jgi:hypothetical protein
MALIFSTSFIDGVLEIHDQNLKLYVSQPFRPTADGSCPDWENEQQALDWWETRRESFEVQFVSTEVVDEPTENESQSSSEQGQE